MSDFCSFTDGNLGTARRLSRAGIEASVEKVTDFTEIRKYQILATPGLVVNEKLVCAGRVPSVAEVTTWLANTLV